MNKREANLITAQAFQEKFGDDPVGWIHEFIDFTGLKYHGLTPQQEEICRALVEHKRIAVSSGGGIGKTACTALLILWGLACHPYAKIPTTAPTNKQLEDVLWAELDFWLKRCKVRHMFVRRARKLYVDGFKEWYAVARTVPKDKKVINDTLAGFHAPWLMIAVDEACFDEETEILTRNGWAGWDEVCEGMEVLTMDPATGKAEFRPVTKVHRYEHSGDAYFYEADNISFVLSPSHRVLYRKRNARKGVLTELRQAPISSFDITKKNEFYMERKVDFEGEDRPWHVIPELRSERKVFEAKKVPMELWCRLVGWFVSEGCFKKQNGKLVGITIAQQDPGMRAVIADVLVMLGFVPHVSDRDVVVYDMQLAEALRPCGDGAFNKRIPPDLKNLKREYVFSLLSAIAHGDGHVKKKSVTVYTMSKQLADDIQEVAIKAGLHAAVTRRKIGGQVKWIKDHFAVTSADDYMVYISFEEPRRIKIRTHRIERKPFSGLMWCVTVPPYHTIYVRRKGRCFWTCNSGVPDPVFTALEGAMTQENSYILLISNPVSTGGYFYDTISDPEGKGRDYKVFFFSSLDSPLVDEGYEEKIANRWGRNSPMYKAKVLGQPIELLERVVVPPDVFDRVVEENRLAPLGGSVVLGVDVGGRGEDMSVICHRRGNSIVEWNEFHTNDTTQLVDAVVDVWQTKYKGDMFCVVVDALGLGAGVFDLLDKMRLFPVVAHEGSKKAMNERAFANRRTEVYWRLKEKPENLHFPVRPPERLKKELANLMFDLDGERVALEEKRKFKARLGFSPDYADALAMTFAVESFVVQYAAAFMRPRVRQVFGGLVMTQRGEKYGRFSKFVA